MMPGNTDGRMDEGDPAGEHAWGVDGTVFEPKLEGQ